MIFPANQWTGLFMIVTSVMQDYGTCQITINFNRIYQLNLNLLSIETMVTLQSYPSCKGTFSDSFPHIRFPIFCLKAAFHYTNFLYEATFFVAKIFDNEKNMPQIKNSFMLK